MAASLLSGSKLAIGYWSGIFALAWIGILLHGAEKTEPQSTLRTSRPIVIAHRGDQTKAHENSVAAIENAIRGGADYVEIDVRRTRDLHHVLLHDSTLDRTTDGVGAVSGVTVVELLALNLTNRTRPDLPAGRVPTLEEALRITRGRAGLYLDFKDGDRAVVAQRLREFGMVENTVVYDEIEHLAEWRRFEPQLRTIATPGSRMQDFEAWRELRTTQTPDLLDGPITDYTQARVLAAKRAGFLVWPDVQGQGESRERWSLAIDWEVDGMMTDFPGELVEFLRQRGLHN